MMGKQKQLTKQHHEGRWGKVDTPHVRDNRGKPQKPQQDHCEKPNKPQRGRTSISKKGVQNTALSGCKVTILPLIAQTDEGMQIPRLPEDFDEDTKLRPSMLFDDRGTPFPNELLRYFAKYKKSCKLIRANKKDYNTIAGYLVKHQRIEFSWLE